MTGDPLIAIRQIEDYKFVVEFGPNIANLTVDETPPIGGGSGPSPEQMLVASVANCLCASLVFALAKYRQDGQGISAEVRCDIARNGGGRLRVHGISVAISLGAAAETMPRIDSVLAQFQQFCTVSESVRAGIPVVVAVHDRQGKCLT